MITLTTAEAIFSAMGLLLFGAACGVALLELWFRAQFRALRNVLMPDEVQR